MKLDRETLARLRGAFIAHVLFSVRTAIEAVGHNKLRAGLTSLDSFAAFLATPEGELAPVVHLGDVGVDLAALDQQRLDLHARVGRLLPGQLRDLDEAHRRVEEAQLFIEACHACYARMQESKKSGVALGSIGA